MSNNLLHEASEVMYRPKCCGIPFLSSANLFNPPAPHPNMYIQVAPKLFVTSTQNLSNRITILLGTTFFDENPEAKNSDLFGTDPSAGPSSLMI